MVPEEQLDRDLIVPPESLTLVRRHFITVGVKKRVHGELRRRLSC